MHSTRTTFSPTGNPVHRDAVFNALQRDMTRLNAAGNRAVDWLRVEQHSSLLISANPDDLHSYIRYTLARMHLAGLYGLCEGLEKLTALLQHRWKTLIPLSVNARMTLLTWLSVQIQAVINSERPVARDLPLLYLTESWLVSIEEALGTYTLKHLIQLSRLKVLVSQTISGLKAGQESAAMHGKNNRISDPDSGKALFCLPPENVGFQRKAAVLWRQSRSFLSGVLVTVIIGGTGLAGHYLAGAERERAQLIAQIAEQLLPEAGAQNVLAHSQPAGATADDASLKSQAEAGQYIGVLLGELEKNPSSYALHVRVEYK